MCVCVCIFGNYPTTRPQLRENFFFFLKNRVISYPAKEIRRRTRVIRTRLRAPGYLFDPRVRVIVLPSPPFRRSNLKSFFIVLHVFPLPYTYHTRNYLVLKRHGYDVTRLLSEHVNTSDMAKCYKKK